MIQQEAVESSMEKLRKKLKKRDMEFHFFAETPLKMIVKRDETQMSVLDDDSMVIALTMERWGEIRYSFQNCDKFSFPEDFLRCIKAGFKEIAGDYLMLMHYVNNEMKKGASEL